MIRVVFDSNVYISAFVFGGVPKDILQLAESGCFELAASQPILDEVERVLLKKFGWSKGRNRMACQPL